MTGNYERSRSVSLTTGSGPLMCIMLGRGLVISRHPGMWSSWSLFVPNSIAGLYNSLYLPRSMVSRGRGHSYRVALCTRVLKKWFWPPEAVDGSWRILVGHRFAAETVYYLIRPENCGVRQFTCWWLVSLFLLVDRHCTSLPSRPPVPFLELAVYGLYIGYFDWASWYFWYLVCLAHTAY